VENSKYIVTWEEGQRDCQVIGMMWMKKMSKILDEEEMIKFTIKSRYPVRNVMVYKLEAMPWIKFTPRDKIEHQNK